MVLAVKSMACLESNLMIVFVVLLDLFEVLCRVTHHGALLFCKDGLIWMDNVGYTI